MRTYQPAIDILEDRLMPALVRPFLIPTPPPATHFQVSVPADVEAGKAFKAIVTALDASNHVVTGFKGIVQISLATADAGATLPASYSFTTADHGKHAFQLTLSATGPQTVKATSGKITGTANLTVDAPVTHFGVSAFGQAMIGSPTIINVVALDANNRAVPAYSGTIHFTSTDGFALLPADYTFTPADGGSHLFQATFWNVGKTTLVATDKTDGSLAASASIKVQSWWRYTYPVYPSSWYYPGYANWQSPWF